MRKIFVSEKAVRELIRESLSSKNDDVAPVNVNDVVDKSAVVTDPSNFNYSPDDYQELGVALQHLIRGVPQADIPHTYEKIVKVVRVVKGESKVPESKNNSLVEALVRAQVRKIIRENRSLLEAFGEEDPLMKGKRQYEKGEVPWEKIKASDPELASLALGTIHGAGHRGKQGVYSAKRWGIPLDTTEYEQVRTRLLKRLYDESTQAWLDGDESYFPISSKDAMSLSRRPEIKRGIDQYVDYWLPENIENPEEMKSDEELEDIRNNPAIAVTLPGFFIAFMHGYLKNNPELFSQTATYLESPEHIETDERLNKQYGNASQADREKNIGTALRSLGAGRPANDEYL